MTAIEKSVIDNRNYSYTIASYVTVLAIFINLNSLKSPFIGLAASATYFTINTIFLGNVFFAKENTFFRLSFGVLLLIMLLGLVGWLIMIIYNLDVLRSTLALALTTTLTSLLNAGKRNKLAEQ